MVVDQKLNVSQQGDAAAKKANVILGCIKRRIVSQSCEVLVPFWPHFESCVQFWIPHIKKDANKLEQVQRRATRMMIRGLETKPCEERLKEPCMLSLEKSGLRGDKTALFKCLKGSPPEEGQDLFSIIPQCRTRNHGLNVQEARFRLSIRKKT